MGVYGRPQPIKRLADAIGFQYAYDPELRQYAHPVGLLFSRRRAVSPITFFRRGVFPRDLRLALMESGVAAKIGSPVEQLLLTCYHYDPTTGKYNPLILNCCAGRAG
jgi:protein SCO1/2